ncbi:MAG: hypothetical protein PHO81_05680, partial [Candidatus Omnitrophica bacterium]|nr:hypothetical protein [Candidatus Omnitrophota bacterium]
AASLCILAGTAYFILKSTFLYRDVIIICIKGLSLLIIVNGFNSFLPGYLNSMQIFGILLFFCICALTKDCGNIFLILSVAFIFDLAAAIRTKFYVIFRNAQRTQYKYLGVNFLFIVILAISGFLAWVLFMNMPMGKIRMLEKLKEEELILTEEKEGLPIPEDQIQKELTRLTFKLSSPEEMRQVLAAIQDMLIKEKPLAYEVSRAQGDILKTLDNPVLASEGKKVEELRSAIKAYIKAKILNNLSRIKNDINKLVEDSRVGLRKRFSVLSSLNKLEYSNSLEAIDRHSEQLRSAINDTPIPEETKKQLKQFNNQFREWKAYQVYSRKFNSFQKQINSMSEARKQDFKELARQIGNINTASDSKTVERSIEKIRQVSLLEDDKLIEEAGQLLKLKRVMLASKEISRLRKKLEDSGESVDRPPELEDALGAVEESRGSKEVMEKINKLLKRLREDNYFRIPKEAKDALSEKVENIIKESVEALKKRISESNLPDSGEKLLEGIKEMDAQRQAEKITAASAKMQEALKKFHEQGSITRETRDSLMQDIKKVEQLFVARAELESIGRQDSQGAGKSQPLGDKQQLEKLLKNTSIDEAGKERIKELLEKLQTAQTVFQIEDVI